MPLRFKDRPAPLSTFKVLEFKLGLDQYVIVGHEPACQVVKSLHWLAPQRRSVPCLDEDCPWHHLPTREALYRPCLYADLKHWKIGIIPFTSKMLPFLDTEYRGKIYKFFRHETYNGPVKWSFQEHMRPCTIPVPSIDVVPSLLRMWGEYCNYKIRLPEVQAGDGDPTTRAPRPKIHVVDEPKEGVA